MIPTFRAGPDLHRCLEALAAQTIDGCEVIVVDDGSGDDRAAQAAAAHPSVRLVVLPSNRGFCGAANAGLEAAAAPIVALLNDDTEPEPAWAEALLRAFEDPQVGFCASRMLQLADPGVVDGAGDGYSRYGLSFRVGRGEPDAGFPARDVLWASGGACAYRAVLLQRVGLLDERLEAYYEDVDLGIRAVRAGFRGRYVPGSTVLHAGSASDVSGRSVRLTTRNALLVVAKHWPAPLIVRNLPFLLYGQARTAAWAARTGTLRWWLGGIRDALGHWRKMRRGERRDGEPWWRLMDLHHPFTRRLQPARLRQPPGGAPTRTAR